MEISRQIILVILPISIASMLLTFLAILAITGHDDTVGLPDSLVNRRLNVNMELARVTTRRVQSFGADRFAGFQTSFNCSPSLRKADLGDISERQIY